MNRRLRLVLLLLSLPAFSGCAAGGSYVVLREHPDGSLGRLAVHDGAQVTLLEQRDQALMIGAYAQPFTMSPWRVQAEFAPALAARPEPPERFMIRFGDDGWRLTPASMAALDRAVDAARRREYPLVAVIGHTDRLGYKAVNLQVGLRRAQRVAKLLGERGVQAMELQVSSHGELDPLVRTPDATAEPRNRRVEIYVR